MQLPVSVCRPEASWALTAKPCPLWLSRQSSVFYHLHFTQQHQHCSVNLVHNSHLNPTPISSSNPCQSGLSVKNTHTHKHTLMAHHRPGNDFNISVGIIIIKSNLLAGGASTWWESLGSIKRWVSPWHHQPESIITVVSLFSFTRLWTCLAARYLVAIGQWNYIRFKSRL